MLINEYRVGTPLGWHRDSPEYNLVAGVSLGAPCRMRFRPFPPQPRVQKVPILSLELAPRSAYQRARRRALALAAQRSGDEGVALLDHLSYLGRMRWLALL